MAFPTAGPVVVLSSREGGMLWKSRVVQLALTVMVAEGKPRLESTLEMRNSWIVAEAAETLGTVSGMMFPLLLKWVRVKPTGVSVRTELMVLSALASD